MSIEPPTPAPSLLLLALLAVLDAGRLTAAPIKYNQFGRNLPDDPLLWSHQVCRLMPSSCCCRRHDATMQV